MFWGTYGELLGCALTCECFRTTTGLNIMNALQSITVIVLLTLKLSQLWLQKGISSWLQSILVITPKSLIASLLLWFDKLFHIGCYTFPVPDLKSVLFQGGLFLFMGNSIERPQYGF